MIQVFRSILRNECVQRTMLHQKARCPVYPTSEQKRVRVPDEKVPWSVEYESYNPPNFTAPVVKKGPVWADPDISGSGGKHKINFNKKDGLVNRVSFTGEYKLSTDSFPMNPKGRTGLSGRGLLGKWGPNHAADPIVTRWYRNQNGDIIKDAKSGKPLLQFVAIIRKDSGEWAIPGGMVDAGENVSLTLKREFGEEALNSLESTVTERKNLERSIADLFSKGTVIYKGYVDDPRNTDNAWMETVAVNFHDDDGTSASRLPFQAGDDAGSVSWKTMSRSLDLYASHTGILQKVANLHGAHW